MEEFQSVLEPIRPVLPLRHRIRTVDRLLEEEPGHWQAGERKYKQDWRVQRARGREDAEDGVPVDVLENAPNLWMRLCGRGGVGQHTFGAGADEGDDESTDGVRVSQRGAASTASTGAADGNRAVYVVKINRPGGRNGNMGDPGAADPRVARLGFPGDAPRRCRQSPKI